MTTTVYEVNAYAIDNGKPQRLFTGSPLLTLKECDRVIEAWQKDHKYKLLISWVSVRYASGTTKIVHLKEYF